MIRWLTILVLCVGAGALVYFLLVRGATPRGGEQAGSPSDTSVATESRAQPASHTTSAAQETTSQESSASNPAVTPFSTTPVVPATPFIFGAADKPPAMEPAIVLNNMRIAIHQYGSRFGGNPVGTNPEITKALNGGNPKEVRFLSEDSGLRINARGELVDYWGTPFFFHQLSASVMEIHSAGPDRVMWTPDDLVTK